MPRKLVVGNWKMHGSRSENSERFSGLRDRLSGNCEHVDVAVCVPFPFLAQAEDELQYTAISWGSQDVSAHLIGAYTGEVSPTMVEEFGCRYVIVGHSERRAYHGEEAVQIAMKVRRAVESQLTPILCVGETLEQREHGNTMAVVGEQLLDVLERITVEEARSLAIAYEPIWAIGTGKTATSAEAQQVHAHIRSVLTTRDLTLAALRLLYGGSVKAANAAELLGQKDIDGALVGGAALDPAEFSSICLTAEKITKSGLTRLDREMRDN